MIHNLAVPRVQWSTSNLVALRNIFDYLRAHPELAREWRGTVMLTFDDSGDLEIVQVPEIRRFIVSLYSEFPHTLYFLNPDPSAGALMQLVAAVSDGASVVVEGGQVSVGMTESALIAVISALVGAAQFAIEIGDDWTAVVSPYADALGQRSRVLSLVQDALRAAGESNET